MTKSICKDKNNNKFKNTLIIAFCNMHLQQVHIAKTAVINLSFIERNIT